jgi:hypothetical protein
MRRRSKVSFVTGATCVWLAVRANMELPHWLVSTATFSVVFFERVSMETPPWSRLLRSPVSSAGTSGSSEVSAEPLCAWFTRVQWEEEHYWPRPWSSTRLANPIPSEDPATFWDAGPPV